jgi:glutamate synthase (NADPH/NADH) small chain
MSDVFQFLNVARNPGDKVAVEKRKFIFKEIYSPLDKVTSGEQAGRCLSCGNPYCSWECPVHNHIPQWLKLVEDGKLFEAAELSHKTNSLPEICGRVCPQDRLWKAHVRSIKLMLAQYRLVRLKNTLPTKLSKRAGVQICRA